jgi:hypothetical protein
MLGASAAALTQASTAIGSGLTTQLRADPDSTRKNNFAQAITFAGKNPFNKNDNRQPQVPPNNTPADVISTFKKAEGTNAPPQIQPILPAAFSNIPQASNLFPSDPQPPTTLRPTPEFAQSAPQFMPPQIKQTAFETVLPPPTT